jgi:peptidoglycan/LPS O-acetylase OafA/YrhL
MSVETRNRLKPGQLLPELVSARGLAAVWIVLAHTYAKMIEGNATLPVAVEYTRIVVDFFFVLSGFVLAHMYDEAWREGRFSYFGFLARRLARLYPLHLATLLLVLLLVTAGRFMGVEPDNPHDWWSFLVTALLMHSTWATSDLAWNWPSWSVSAEWCAYLAIPLFLALADRVRGSLARIVAGLGGFVAIATFSELALRQELVSLTFDGGALRIAPSFFAGILLRRMFDDEPAFTAMTPRAYAAAVGGVFAVCAALVALGSGYDALWPPMIVLVAALASRGTWPSPGVLRGRLLAWLGELSYALYLIHAIALQVVFALAERLGLATSLGERAILGVIAIAATIVGSHIAYVVVERPGRRVVANLFLRPRTGSPAPQKSGAA